MHQLDRSWAEGVCWVCDPGYTAADVGFARQIHEGPRRGITALLWEADPQMFAERYPDSGIVESYGTQWPDVTCIDFCRRQRPAHLLLRTRSDEHVLRGGS